jgi:signal transduction histidine kinase
LEAKTKGVVITAARTGDLRVLGDREGLRRAFTNLVQNAVKFSSPDSMIRVNAAKVPGGVEVTVSDEGPGIPDEHLGRIFERFYRVPAAETVGLPGCGLGLYIVKGVVQQHGGHVLAESELGQGTVFRVFLPGWEDENVEEKASAGR